MGHQERAKAAASASATMMRGAGLVEGAHASGVYKGECLRPIASLIKHYKRISDGIHALQARAPLFGDELLELIRLQGQMHDFATVQWKADAPNLVCNEGAAVMLDALTSTYTVVGPYLGLISNTSWSAVNAADTMAQIAGTNGWREAGNTNAPTYTYGGSGVRATPSWSAASGKTKADSANNSFLLTSGTNVTIQGCFLVIASGAQNVISTTSGSDGGKLWSAGVFSGGAKTNCNSGDTVNVRYTTTL